MVCVFRDVFPFLLHPLVWFLWATAAGAAQTDPDDGWLTDYAAASSQARREAKMLLVYFRPSPDSVTRRQFEEQTLVDDRVRQLLQDYVRLRVPADYTVRLSGSQTSLLGHPAFAEMRGQPGLAIVDYRHQTETYYERVVSCLPFVAPVYYAPPYHSRQSVQVLLDLPPGSITQRTMVYAVRIHPQRPASTSGAAHAVLLAAARRHSQHQSRITTQGHHGWNQRAAAIHGQVGGEYPTEICAESWPGKRLLEACLDCVASWRQSPGHWRSVSRRQPAFGYDIRRGHNGIWYATGIFGGHGRFHLLR